MWEFCSKRISPSHGFIGSPILNLRRQPLRSPLSKVPRTRLFSHGPPDEPDLGCIYQHHQELLAITVHPNARWRLAFSGGVCGHWSLIVGDRNECFENIGQAEQTEKPSTVESSIARSYEACTWKNCRSPLAFLAAFTPHRSPTTTSNLGHGSQVPTTQGAGGRCSSVKRSHRSLKSRQDLECPTDSQGYIWLG